MNPQLADELRKALQDAITRMDRARATLCHDGNWGMLDTTNLKAALLAQHAVAEPQRQCWYSDNVVCPYSNQRDDKPAVLAPAHAAEQPKLTEEPEFSAKLDGAIKQGIDNWRVWGSSEIQDEGYLRVMLREQIYRLLTSPVAPPPGQLTWQHLSHAFTIANDFRNDDDERYFTVMLNALNSISREGTVDPAAPKGLDRSSQNDSNPTAASTHHCDTPECHVEHKGPKPVAPGEQPPRPTGNYWCCKANFGEHEPTCKNYVPPAPPAQERASDEPPIASRALQRILVGNTWQQCVNAFERALATAASQAREGARQLGQDDVLAELSEELSNDVKATLVRKGCRLAAQPFPQKKEDGK